MPIVTAFDAIAKSLKASAEQAKKVTTAAPVVAPVVKTTTSAPVTSAASAAAKGAAAGVSAGIAAAKKAVETAPVVKVSEPAPVVKTTAPPAPTETRKTISGEIMGNRNFTVIQVKPVTGDVYYTVEEGGKTVSGFENVTDSGSIHWKLGKAVYGEKYGEPSVTTVEPKDVNLVTYFDTTKIPVSADTLSKYEKYLPTDKDVPLVIQAPPREGTTGTPESLGATVVIPGQKPTEAQAAFIEKVTVFEKKEAPHRTEMTLGKWHYAGKSETGEPLYVKESPAQVLHDYNPATQDISQQQLYSQLESDFGSELDVATKNIEVATEAQKNIPFAEEYLSQLNIAIGDVTKAGEYDDIFLVENGVEVKYKRDEALNKLGSQLEVRQEYLDWKAGKREKMSDDNLTAAEYLDWAKTTSEKLPEYQSGLHYVSTQKFTASKYKELGYKVKVTDEGYSFELPSSTEVYQWKHGEMTGAALSSAAFLESPLAVKTLGSAIQSAITGDKKVGEARIEELSTYALGLDVAIKQGDYAMHVLASPAVVEGILLPVVTLGATSIISEGLNLAAPRIVAGLGNVGSKFSPQGQAYIAKLTIGAKTVAEPFVAAGKAVVGVGSKLPSTALTRKASGQALNWEVFGAIEGGGLIKVASEKPETFGGVLAQSAFTWGVITSAMGQGMKNLDIKMPEFKSTPAMIKLEAKGSARMDVLVRKFDYKVAAPVKDVLGDVKYAIKTELKIPEIKAGLADIKAVARREIYSTIPIQETRADIRAAGAKFTEFGEKVSEKVEVPIAKFKKAGAEFKAEIKDTFYEKVPGAGEVRSIIQEYKLGKAEVAPEKAIIKETWKPEPQQITLDLGKGSKKVTVVEDYKPTYETDYFGSKDIYSKPSDGYFGKPRKELPEVPGDKSVSLAGKTEYGSMGDYGLPSEPIIKPKVEYNVISRETSDMLKSISRKEKWGAFTEPKSPVPLETVADIQKAAQRRLKWGEFKEPKTPDVFKTPEELALTEEIQKSVEKRLKWGEFTEPKKPYYKEVDFAVPTEEKVITGKGYKAELAGKEKIDVAYYEKPEVQIPSGESKLSIEDVLGRGEKQIDLGLVQRKPIKYYKSAKEAGLPDEPLDIKPGDEVWKYNETLSKWENVTKETKTLKGTTKEERGVVTDNYEYVPAYEKTTVKRPLTREEARLLNVAESGTRTISDYWSGSVKRIAGITGVSNLGRVGLLDISSGLTGEGGAGGREAGGDVVIISRGKLGEVGVLTGKGMTTESGLGTGVRVVPGIDTHEIHDIPPFEEGESKEDILKIGLTEQTGGTVLEQRLGLKLDSVLEQQLLQRLKYENRTILDVSPTTGKLPGKPFRPIWIPRGRRTGQEEEEVVFGKKKKKKAAAKTRPGRKDILADIVSVTRSQARFGKATHPKMSQKVYEEAARTGFRHIPTTELKTKQYTPRVKSNGLRLDSNKLMVGNLKTKVNIRRGKRNAPRKKRWI